MRKQGWILIEFRKRESVVWDQLISDTIRKPLGGTVVDLYIIPAGGGGGTGICYSLEVARGGAGGEPETERDFHSGAEEGEGTTGRHIGWVEM